MFEAGLSFQVIVVEWRGIFRYLLPGGWYVHYPTRLFRQVSPAIAVVAEKKPAGHP